MKNNASFCYYFNNIRVPTETELKENLLSQAATYLLTQCIDMVNNNRMSYIAYTINKIGDSILASVSEEKFFNP